MPTVREVMMLTLLLWLGLAPLPQAAQEAGAAAPRPRSEDVRYRNGPVELAAELLLPEAADPTPAAVIIQGSGPSSRSNSWARAIAEELVRNGLAVLLTDKRGSGASGGDWQTAGFDDLAGDALAGVQMLRGRREVDPERVGLVGLSQGGWIAPLAAARSREVAFVVDVSGAAVSYAEQSFFEMANTARQAGLDQAGVKEVLELNRAAGEYLVTGDWERYARARSSALGRPWKKIAEGFPGAPELPIWTFLRRVVAYDPMPYWALLTEPVLVVFGEEDERDNVPVAESVRRLEHAFGSVGKTNHQIVVVPGAGHSLMDRQGRLMPELTGALASWLNRHVTAAGHPAKR